MANSTPFENDIQEQPAALRRLAAGGEWELDGLEQLRDAGARVILTGMGSSDYVSRPTWRRLVNAGFTAWHVDAGQLLEAPELITPGTTLIATSQSGASGEVVELLNRLTPETRAAIRVIGIADPEDSPLATRSDVFLPLLSGPEATVSAKSYLNATAVHRMLTARVVDGSDASVRETLPETAALVEKAIAEVDVADLAQTIAGAEDRRLAFIGWGDHSTTALYAALIVKEAAKIPAEGYVGGEFRHGPLELAGPGLTAVLLGSQAADPDPRLRRLAEELIASGSNVVFIGDDTLPGAIRIPVERGSGIQPLAVDAVVVQLLAVQLAKANGVEPGAFLFGRKVTTLV